MMPRANILVSGVAGDIGFGAGRILREADWDGQLHGIDIHPDHPGSAVFDACSVAPRASEPSYIDWLSRYIVGCGIDVFIPTSEAEISRLTEERLDRVAGAVVLKANELTIRKSLDKNACLDFLSHAGVEVPAHGLLAQRQPDRYPVILKPRSGQGSKGIVRAERADQLPDARDSNLVWQEYLAPDHEEYTCGVFRSARVATRVLVMRRKLQGGLTGSGEVVDHPEISRYVASIAQALQLDGCMNVQLRLTSAGPLLFEVNPRLSSTLVFRDKMGFCDLKWWLAEKLGSAIPEYIPPMAGTRFFRGAQEYILFD